MSARARARLLLAVILTARGDRAAAVVELDTARGHFIEMGTPKLVERTARLRKVLNVA